MIRPRFLSILLPVLGWNLGAAPVQTDHVLADLVSEQAAIAPGQPFTVGLHLQLDEHWHVYWVNPGDSGMAPAINWQLPEGFSAGEVQWPTPHRIPTPPFMTYGYEEAVLLMVEITPPADLAPGSSVELKAKADWLVCAEVCIPGEAELSLELPVEDDAAANAETAALFENARENLPVDRSAAWAATFTASGPNFVVEIDVPEPVPALDDVYFFATDELVIEPSKAQHASMSDDGKLLLRIPRSTVSDQTPETLRGVLTSPAGFGSGSDTEAVYIEASRESPTTTSAAESATPFLATAALGFVGGLILNLMPCVFPVIGIKILGFVQQAGVHRSKVTLHGLMFTAGVLVSFWVLAGVLAGLRAGGEQLGWGFQLQSPAFVFVLAIFLLIFALNLTGWFEIGLSATAVGGSLHTQSGLSGSFLSGVLATVVATPCAAPFLAPALGAAITLPTVKSFTLFTVIGLGLATPYLLLSIFPHLVKVLPRPGAWMETFRQIMAFPLYATVGFLVWVLAGQVSEGAFLNILLALVLVAMAGWAYGRWTQQGGGTGRKTFGYVFAGLLLVGGVAFGWPKQESATDVVWREWSPEAVERFTSEGNIVYVDFTARWCATCKVNKAVVFSSEEVHETFKELDVVALKADWTNKNPAITEALASFGRSAVPFNLIYAPGHPEPTILPEVLTPGIVLDALDDLRPPRTAAPE